MRVYIPHIHAHAYKLKIKCNFFCLNRVLIDYNRFNLIELFIVRLPSSDSYLKKSNRFLKKSNGIL